MKTPIFSNNIIFYRKEHNPNPGFYIQFYKYRIAVPVDGSGAQPKPSGYLYNVSDKLLKAVFAKHYPEMEQVFLKAEREIETQKQKARFQLLKDNLVLLQATLREKKMLTDDFKSPLQCNEAQIQQILEKPYADFKLFPKRLP